jgi:putative ABC transport system permease protein
MPDWTQYVRQNLRLSGLRIEREAEVTEDLGQQLEDAYADALRRGLSPSDAEAATKKHITDWLALAKQVERSGYGRESAMSALQNRSEDRDVARRGDFSFFTGLMQDIRFGLRMLRKNPGFAIAAIIVLALGIGANTAVFSLVNAVLLRPLPFPEPQRLMAVRLTDPRQDMFGAFGDADFIAFRDQQKSFSHIAAYVLGRSEFNFSNGGEPGRVHGVAVTADFFETLGLIPERGRTFQPQDDRAEAQPVVVVSHEFWQRQLDSDPKIVGSAIKLNGRLYIVTGVMRPSIRFPQNESVDVWPLMRMQTSQGRPPYYLAVFGRLMPGVIPRQAAEELSTIAHGVEQTYPNSTAWVGRVEPLKARMTQNVRTQLWVILAAVAFVLLIALVNVANLLLARATARQKEICIRIALGASRSHVIRQLVTESLILAGAGGFFGVLLAAWAQTAFVSLGSMMRIPMAYQATLDARVLFFTVGISVVSGVLFGLAPALHAKGESLNDSLRDSARAGSSAAGLSARRVLVATEFSLAFVLLVGSVLLVRSFVRLQEVNPGFNSDHILTAEITLPSALYRDDKAIVSFWDEFLRRTNSMPGVKSVSLTISLPPPPKDRPMTNRVRCNSRRKWRSPQVISRHSASPLSPVAISMMRTGARRSIPSSSTARWRKGISPARTLSVDIFRRAIHIPRLRRKPSLVSSET